MASVDRADGYLFRMSLADKQRLKAEAVAEGLTFQQLLEKRVLGAAKPVGRDGRPRRRPSQREELPIAG